MPHSFAAHVEITIIAQLPAQRESPGAISKHLCLENEFKKFLFHIDRSSKGLHKHSAALLTRCREMTYTWTQNMRSSSATLNTLSPQCRENMVCKATAYYFRIFPWMSLRQDSCCHKNWVSHSHVRMYDIETSILYMHDEQLYEYPVRA